MKKPEECQLCPGNKICTGFVPDFSPPNPKIAVVLKMPSREEVTVGQPMVGPTGKYWDSHILRKAGLNRSEVLITNSIRCFPGNHFPVGQNKLRMYQYCRQWDGAIKTWNPSLIGITYNPTTLVRTPAEQVFVERAFQKAALLAQMGERPLLLCGEEAKEIFAPHLKGPMKKWAGHFEPIKSEKP